MMLKDWYDILVKRFPELTLAVGGTYALQLQGIELKRKPHDIDLMIVHSCGTSILEKYRRFFRFLYKYDGPYIDWMEEKWETNDNDYILVDGVLCFTIENIIKGKQFLIDSGKLKDEAIEKHKKDIIEIERQLKEKEENNSKMIEKPRLMSLSL